MTLFPKQNVINFKEALGRLTMQCLYVFTKKENDQDSLVIARKKTDYSELMLDILLCCDTFPIIWDVSYGAYCKESRRKVDRFDLSLFKKHPRMM